MYSFLYANYSSIKCFSKKENVEKCATAKIQKHQQSHLLRFRIGEIHFSYHLTFVEGSDAPPGGFLWSAH